jgi:excisionase family DNA binding protein
VQLDPLQLQGVEGQSNGKRRITVREAATLLGVHPNTVRSRIKDGSIEAEKVITVRGPTWMIDPDSLTANTTTSDSQQLVSRVPQEALTILAREIVREAGLQPDPHTAAMRARLQSYADTFRHLSTLSGATAVGVTVLGESLNLSGRSMVVALVTLGAAFVIALLCTTLATGYLGLSRWDHNESQYFPIWMFLTGALLAGGIGALVGNLLGLFG